MGSHYYVLLSGQSSSEQEKKIAFHSWSLEGAMLMHL